MNNLQLQQEETNINTALSNLKLVLYNSSILLYQKIVQKSISYAPFENAVVNYSYVSPNLQYDFYFGINQIQAVITYYVSQVNNVLTMIIASGIESQFNSKINTINQSVAQLNNWSIALYNGQNNKAITYTTPYAMSIRSALLLNNLTLNNMSLVILFNMDTINTVNYIEAGVQLLLL